MAHIGEEELGVYAWDPDALGPARCAEIERELAACAECRTTFEFLAVAGDDEASDPDVWERSDGSPQLDSLRVHAARVGREDAEAAELLEPLFAAPAQVAWKSFRSKRYRTGGVVRKLLAHAATLHEREPLAALTYADAAILIAEKLPDETYPAKAVYQLCGTAWKERANALRVLGRFDEGLESLRRAARAYKALARPTRGLASVAYVRAMILLEQQRLAEAAEAAATAEQAFFTLGDDERRMSALHLTAGIAFERRDIETAIHVFRRVAEYGQRRNDALWMARTSQALGNCYLDDGRPSEARVQFHTALTLFRKLGQQTEITRTEWGIARLIIDTGKLDEGIRRLGAVITDFASAGMVADAALAGLDLAAVVERVPFGPTSQRLELSPSPENDRDGLGDATPRVSVAMTASPFVASAQPLRILTFAHLQRLDRSSDHYLQDCYRKETAVRASEFASFLGVTHEYLSTMVRQLTGMTLHDYLRSKQLRYAEQLLQVKQLKVEEIALRSGFGTPGTFHRCFNAKYGMTPTAFRSMKK